MHSFANHPLDSHFLSGIDMLNLSGGTLIGYSASFADVAKIKGTHNAMEGGMLPTEAALDAVATSEDAPADMSAYETSLHKSWVHDDLYKVRNVRPCSTPRSA